MQNEIAFNQHGHRVVGVHHREVFGLVVEIDINDLEIHAFFMQDDAALVAKRVGGAGIQSHHKA